MNINTEIELAEGSVRGRTAANTEVCQDQAISMDVTVPLIEMLSIWSIFGFGHAPVGVKT